MLSIGWLLAPLLLGVSAVSAEPCERSGCGLANDARLQERSAEAAGICQTFGFDGDRIRPSTHGAILQPIGSLPTAALDDMRDTEMFLAMATLASKNAREATLVGNAGVVSIDEPACTICERCTTVCPTGALASKRREDGIDITFDASNCVGCSMCVAICPEQAKQAITVHRRFDADDLTTGRQTLIAGSTATCERCGGQIAPSAMLDRIRSALGPEHAATLNLIERRCIDCR